jgi:hypothetical protein
METFIQSTEELQKYVKVNRSIDFETYRQYLIDAQDKYITPYIGQSLIDKLMSDNTDQLSIYVCRALGPFSLALSTDEFSINFGESGHTVTRTDDKAPASDAKIAKAAESLYNRG